MNRLYIRKQVILLITMLIVFCLAVVDDSNADENPSTLSGRIINVDGEPIKEKSIVLLYVKIRENGQVDPLYGNSHYPFFGKRLSNVPPEIRKRLSNLPPENQEQLPNQQDPISPPPFLKAQTDSEGRFTFTQISTGLVQLLVLPSESKQKDPNTRSFTRFPEIHAIKFGKISFYPYEFLPSPEVGGVTFAIKPGANIQDVEVILKTQPKEIQPEEHIKIQGRIIFKDGKPLADASLKIGVGVLVIGNTSGFSSSKPIQTDAEGNFVLSVAIPGFYVLSVDHLGLSSTSEPFVLNAGVPHEGLVLKLNGNESELAVSSPEDIESEDRRSPSRRQVPKIWVVNPENGHAYKAIQCKNREDAQTQAEAEAAHLVTITSEAEQVWLEVVFKDESYWLGLIYVAFGSKWMWETGEPLTYTHWTLDDKFGRRFGNLPPNVPGMERHYAVMSREGDWNAVALKGPFEGRARMAIIERDGFRAKKLDNIK